MVIQIFFVSDFTSTKNMMFVGQCVPFFFSFSITIFGLKLATMKEKRVGRGEKNGAKNSCCQDAKYGIRMGVPSVDQKLKEEK
jgi:hypothetical protein